jgi:hypothetical protein
VDSSSSNAGAASGFGLSANRIEQLPLITPFKTRSDQIVAGAQPGGYETLALRRLRCRFAVVRDPVAAITRISTCGRF